MSRGRSFVGQNEQNGDHVVGYFETENSEMTESRTEFLDRTRQNGPRLELNVTNNESRTKVLDRTRQNHDYVIDNESRTRQNHEPRTRFLDRTRRNRDCDE